MVYDEVAKVEDVDRVHTAEAFPEIDFPNDRQDDDQSEVRVGIIVNHEVETEADPGSHLLLNCKHVGEINGAHQTYSPENGSDQIGCKEGYKEDGEVREGRTKRLDRNPIYLLFELNEERSNSFRVFLWNTLYLVKDLLAVIKLNLGLVLYFIFLDHEFMRQVRIDLERLLCAPNQEVTGVHISRDRYFKSVRKIILYTAIALSIVEDLPIR